LKFRIEYSPDTEEHLRKLTKRNQVIVMNSILNQLQEQPDYETKNRKPMRPNPIAPWELRIGNLRVYYDFELHPKPVVYIRAVGIKQRNRVIIGKEEIDL
jgi:mRNA-degrading endonuclease RelE of RelBE toxin-antitoxin system